MDPNASGIKRGLAGAGLFPIALAKLSGTTIRGILNPSQKMNNIISGVSTVFKHADYGFSYYTRAYTGYSQRYTQILWITSARMLHSKKQIILILSTS